MSCKMPEYFYLYLSLDSFGLRKLIALIQNQLPLTSVRRFNDPFDSKFSFDYSNSAVALNNKEQKGVKEGDVSEEGIVNAKQRTQESIWQNKYHVLCVSESWDLLLMWSHYAGAHQGICLKLKYDHEKMPTDCFFEKVRYSTHLPFPDASRIEEDEQIKTLFLTKSVDWMHEQEWRFFAPAETGDNQLGFDSLIKPSPFSVENVLCGVSCNHQMLFSDLVGCHGATPKRLEILNASMIQKINKALHMRTSNGYILGDFSKILSVLEELRVDEKNDTMETANSKNKISASIIFQFLQDNGWKVGLNKSGKSFQVVMGE